MSDIKIVIDGQEFPIHYQLLSDITDNMPEGEHYKPLSRAILGLNIPSLAQNLVDREVLGIEEMDALWDRGPLDVQRALIGNSKFRTHLTDAQAQKIIELNDREILTRLASWVEELYPDEDEEQAMRLSGAMADKLVEFIANHEDTRIRESLAENSRCPVKYRMSVSQMVQNGFEIGRGDYETFSEADLELLPQFSIRALKRLAMSIEDIKDKNARKKVMNFLVDHPDAGVRLQLAENFRTPQSALRKLAKDADADVAAAAVSNLDEDIAEL